MKTLRHLLVFSVFSISSVSVAETGLNPQKLQEKNQIFHSLERSAPERTIKYFGILDAIIAERTGRGGKAISFRELSTNRSALDPFLGATWEFTYTIISTFTDTIVCQSNVQTASDGWVYVECTHNNKDIAWVSPRVNGEVLITAFNSLEEVYVLNSTADFCNGANGQHHLTSIVGYDSPDELVATRVAGPATYCSNASGDSFVSTGSGQPTSDAMFDPTAGTLSIPRVIVPGPFGNTIYQVDLMLQNTPGAVNFSLISATPVR